MAEVIGSACVANVNSHITLAPWRHLATHGFLSTEEPKRERADREGLGRGWKEDRKRTGTSQQS